jgi:hypothetical protein
MPMEPNVSRSSTIVPLVGSLVGLTFSLSVMAGLVAVTFYAGLYYSIPRMILKQVGQAAMRRS